MVHLAFSSPAIDPKSVTPVLEKKAGKKFPFLDFIDFYKKEPSADIHELASKLLSQQPEHQLTFLKELTGSPLESDPTFLKIQQKKLELNTPPIKTLLVVKPQADIREPLIRIGLIAFGVLGVLSLGFWNQFTNPLPKLDSKLENVSQHPICGKNETPIQVSKILNNGSLLSFNQSLSLKNNFFNELFEKSNTEVFKSYLPPMNGSDSNSFSLEAFKNKKAILKNSAPLFSELEVRASEEQITSHLTAFISDKLGSNSAEPFPLKFKAVENNTSLLPYQTPSAPINRCKKELHLPENRDMCVPPKEASLKGTPAAISPVVLEGPTCPATMNASDLVSLPIKRTENGKKASPESIETAEKASNPFAYVHVLWEGYLKGHQAMVNVVYNPCPKVTAAASKIYATIRPGLLVYSLADILISRKFGYKLTPMIGNSLWLLSKTAIGAIKAKCLRLTPASG